MEAITFSSPVLLLPKLKMHYITVPADVVAEFGSIGTRLLCSVNGEEAFQCGMVALGGGKAYISLSKKRMSAFGVSINDEIQVALELDHSKYGMEIPEELEALLEQDTEGAKLFNALTDGQ